VRYALLVSPSTNRVYAQAAGALARAELCAVSEAALKGAVSDVREETLGSVPYVTFTAEPSPQLHGWLSNLSGTFALFELQTGDGLLRPLELESWDVCSSDLVTIQKYTGKTNEAFTKLLYNVTLAASQHASEPTKKLSVLDPMCGRGTTLGQALMYGHHATGVEHDKKDFEAYALFIQRWVKDQRLKHQATAGSVKGRPKLDLAFGLDKDRFKTGDVLRVNYVCADTLDIGTVFQPRTFDLIVTDAPYGVQHGAKNDGAVSRKPLELLTAALPVWRAALRPGGAIGIAWNTHVARRSELERLVSESFSVCDSPAYRSFEHRVDSSIQRDLIVARVP
jgi:SAM-dependent methyltransferase